MAFGLRALFLLLWAITGRSLLVALISESRTENEANVTDFVIGVGFEKETVAVPH